MNSRQTAAICATILLAALANLAGGFAIQIYFEARHAAFAERLAQLPPPPFFGPHVGEGLETGFPSLLPFEGHGVTDLMPLPPDPEDEQAPLIGDGVGQPAKERAGRRFLPREFPDPDGAAPIQPRPLLEARVIAGIIEAELPNATAEEREVWMKQLGGLGPSEIRNLLQMRRQFGSEIRQLVDLPAPLREEPEDQEEVRALPVEAPVPEDASMPVAAPVPAVNDESGE